METFAKKKSFDAFILLYSFVTQSKMHCVKVFCRLFTASNISCPNETRLIIFGFTIYSFYENVSHFFERVFTLSWFFYYIKLLYLPKKYLKHKQFEMK